MASTQSKRKAVHRLIGGNDEFAVKQRTTALLQESAPEEAMNFEIIDAQAETVDAACQRLAQLQEALLTLPFFGGFKLVHFKNCTFLADNVTGRSESVLASWESIADVLKKTDPGDVQLVISALGVDRRRAFFRTFSTLGEVEFHNLPDLGKFQEARAYAGRIGEMIRDRGLKADPHVPEMFVEMIGNDTRSVHSELDKLALYVHPETHIREEDLRAIVAVTRESIVWDMNDAVIQGDARESVHLLRQLLGQGESEVGIGILLAGQVRLAAVGTYLLEKKQLRLIQSGRSISLEVTPEGEALLPVSKKGEKPNSYRLAKIVDQARKRPSIRWFQAVEILHRTALQLVSSGGDRARLLETAVVKICNL
jgi:DNA polymerase-3 subunit delta